MRLSDLPPGVTADMIPGNQLEGVPCPYCGAELTRAEVARLMRAIPSEARSEAARRNGRMPKRPREETAYRKAIRTGIKPAIWPPIVMTAKDLKHFRQSHGITAD